MTRLTTNIRSKILAAAQTKSGNRDKRAATALKRKEWAEAVRIAAIGDNAAELDAIDKKAEKLRASVPELFRGDGDLIRKRGYLNLNCAGLRVHVSEWDGDKVSPHEFTLTADHALVQQFHDILAEEKANTESWEKVKASVNAATGAVTTVKALLRAWPEVKELLPEDMEEAKSQLPAIQVADLNALVGLPTEGESK